jgi:hypothetical protein
MPKRSGKQSTKQPPPLTEKFDALRQFFSGYLHQDFREEYDSAEDAAKEFCADADPEDVASLRADWKKWWAASQRLPLPEIQASIRKLGAAWLPLSTDEIEQVGNALSNISPGKF